MSFVTTLRRWKRVLRDRSRLATFARFLWGRFWYEQLFQAAGSLAYTTIFALVPLAMVVFSVLSAFPGFSEWSDSLSDYVFSNFVPSAARAAEDYLKEFSARARNLTFAGVIALVISLLITLNSVESVFNRIWRVEDSRPRLGRFIVYWAVLTLGALLATASLAVTSKVFALPFFHSHRGDGIVSFMLSITPFVIELCTIAVIYRVVPHRAIRWRYVFVGALLATIGLELIKWGMGLYLNLFNSYARIYGAMVVAPILMLWIYLGWCSILFGASLASSLSAFRYQPKCIRLPEGHEIYGLLRMLGRFQQAREHGKGLTDIRILRLEPMLTDAMVNGFLRDLSKINVVRCTEDGHWLLARDLESVSLAELYEACQLRIPVNEVDLPRQEDELGTMVCDALDHIYPPVRRLLRQRVGSIYAPKKAAD